MFSPFAGRRLPSRPTAEAGLACSSARLPRQPTSPRPSPAPHVSGLPTALHRAVRPRRVPTVPGRDRRVTAMRRRRSPRGSHGLPRPPALAFFCPPALRSPLHSLTHSAAATAAAAAPACATSSATSSLTGFGSPGHHSSPATTPSRQQLRLHPAHPVLSLLRRGKHPFLGNCSSEHGRAHW